MFNDSNSPLLQASDLVWNETLATGAQKWADKCHYAHSGGSLFDFGYGENIAAGTGSYSTEDLIKVRLQSLLEPDDGAGAHGVCDSPRVRGQDTDAYLCFFAAVVG